MSIETSITHLNNSNSNGISSIKTNQSPCKITTSNNNVNILSNKNMIKNTTNDKTSTQIDIVISNLLTF
jgi:hypothetical protein